VPTYTVSQAKNLMLRTIREILDPGPSQAEIGELRVFFDSKCAYCGADVEPRRAHLDHAEPQGGNHVGNRVLSCGRCNGDEKRERRWLEFHNEKAAGPELSQRWFRIEEWMAKHPRPGTDRVTVKVREQEQLLKELVSRFGAELAGAQLSVMYQVPWSRACGPRPWRGSGAGAIEPMRPASSHPG
jgi:hypothetical protein